MLASCGWAHTQFHRHCLRSEVVLLPSIHMYTCSALPSPTTHMGTHGPGWGAWSRPAYHGQGQDGLHIPLDDRQLSDNPLQVGQGTVASIINVPHDPPLHRLAGEVLHLEVQLQDLQGSLTLPERQTGVGETRDEGQGSAALAGTCLL